MKLSLLVVFWVVAGLMADGIAKNIERPTLMPGDPVCQQGAVRTGPPVVSPMWPAGVGQRDPVHQPVSPRRSNLDRPAPILETTGKPQLPPNEAHPVVQEILQIRESLGVESVASVLGDAPRLAGPCPGNENGFRAAIIQLAIDNGSANTAGSGDTGRLGTMPVPDPTGNAAHPRPGLAMSRLSRDIRELERLADELESSECPGFRQRAVRYRQLCRDLEILSPGPRTRESVDRQAGGPESENIR